MRRRSALVVVAVVASALSACQRAPPPRKLGPEALVGLQRPCTSDTDCGPHQACVSWVRGGARTPVQHTCEIPCDPHAADQGLSDCPAPLSCTGGTTHGPNAVCIR